MAKRRALVGHRRDPTTIKDIVWVKDWAVRYGSRTTSATPCIQDAPSVKRLRAAGAVLIGLTTTPEFGWKAITDSPLTGVTRNPWNPQHDPGRLLRRRRGRGGYRCGGAAYWH
jgi:Asp-tRNA(Asn)/Glu-tRNA(Gln) amidotransferase A subunit family amidase